MLNGIKWESVGSQCLHILYALITRSKNLLCLLPKFINFSLKIDDEKNGENR